MKRKDRNKRNDDRGSACAEQRLDRVANTAKLSRDDLEPTLWVAIHLADAEIKTCDQIVRHAESFADGGRFKATNERVLDIEPKLYEVQHLPNAETLLNLPIKELASRD